VHDDARSDAAHLPPAVKKPEMLKQDGHEVITYQLHNDDHPKPGCPELRTCPEIIESTFERIKYGFTTARSYHMLWW
jgi:hypothetical protein